MLQLLIVLIAWMPLSLSGALACLVCAVDAKCGSSKQFIGRLEEDDKLEQTFASFGHYGQDRLDP